MDTFAELVSSFLADLFRAEPVLATALGDHAHDDAWPDLSADGRAARLVLIDRWTQAFQALPAESLLADEIIDREILLGELAAMHFAETELQEDAWNPLSLVYLAGDGIHLILAREFAPLAARLGDVAARIAGLGRLLDGARERLAGLPGRPPSRLHVETALRDLPGIGELCDEALALATAADEDGELAGLRARLEAATREARAALAAFGRHLETTILPISVGDGRLGAPLFAAKAAHALRLEITPEELEARATREFAAVRAEMIRLARDSWSRYRPGDPEPADDGEAVRGVLDAIAADHPPADGALEACRAALAEARAFCLEQSLVDLPDDPLIIAWTPVFLRSYAGAMLMAPGPLERDGAAFFYVTPPAADWTAEQVESALREDNHRMLRLLVLHEAVPGHALQLARARRSPSPVRAAFGSGVFSEGWAVYVTQVMIDHGFGADDPGFLLTHWKFYLRSAVNALLDVGIHARAMTEEQALALMVDGAFQERSEAVRKYERARLSSAQLSEYFVGSAAMWDLEDEIRRRAAAASDDPRGREVVPVPGLVGGYGATPGFSQHEHLARVLANGSPPIPVLRRLLLGEPDSPAGGQESASTARLPG